MSASPARIAHGGAPSLSAAKYRAKVTPPPPAASLVIVGNVKNSVYAGAKEATPTIIAAANVGSGSVTVVKATPPVANPFTTTIAVTTVQDPHQPNPHHQPHPSLQHHQQEQRQALHYSLAPQSQPPMYFATWLCNEVQGTIKTFVSDPCYGDVREEEREFRAPYFLFGPNLKRPHLDTPDQNATFKERLAERANRVSSKEWTVIIVPRYVPHAITTVHTVGSMCHRPLREETQRVVASNFTFAAPISLELFMKRYTKQANDIPNLTKAMIFLPKPFTALENPPIELVRFCLALDRCSPIVVLRGRHGGAGIWETGEDLLHAAVHFCALPTVERKPFPVAEVAVRGSGNNSIR